MSSGPKKYEAPAVQITDVSGACERLGGIGRTTLYRLFDIKAIDRVKVGSRTFVSIASIDRYLTRRAHERKHGCDGGTILIDFAGEYSAARFNASGDPIISYRSACTTGVQDLRGRLIPDGWVLHTADGNEFILGVWGIDEYERALAAATAQLALEAATARLARKAEHEAPHHEPADRA